MALFLFFAVTAPPPNLPAPHPLRPSVTVLAAVLAAVFSLTFLLLLYAKHCNRHDGAVSYRYPTAYPSGPRASGVDRTVVETLPVFRFGSLTGQKTGLECAVCLAAFQAAEALRLLPKCRHAFHVECVDTWLDAHASCPLCRSRVHAEDVLLLPSPPANAAVAVVGEEVPNPRRVFGRHSSAGERSSKSMVRMVAARARKDGLLPTEAAAIAGGERRFSHRIVVSGGEDVVVKERWSEVGPGDMLYLRSEMMVTGIGRGLGSVAGGVIREKSVLEIAGVS